MIGAIAAGHVAAGNDGGDVPAGADPSRDHRPGGRHLFVADRRAVHARVSAAGRRSTSTSSGRLAVGGRAPGHARGGGRGDPGAVAGRRDHSPRPPLPGRHGRVYTLPERPPQIFMSGFGPKSIELAARVGRRLMCVGPTPSVVRFRDSGGGDKPVQGGLKVCWGGTRGGPARPSTGCGRTTRCPANWPRCCPCPSISSRRPSW